MKPEPLKDRRHITKCNNCSCQVNTVDGVSYHVWFEGGDMIYGTGCNYGEDCDNPEQWKERPIIKRKRYCRLCGQKVRTYIETEVNPEIYYCVPCESYVEKSETTTSFLNALVSRFFYGDD